MIVSKKKIKNILSCPNCKYNQFKFGTYKFQCTKCNSVYKIIDGKKFYFQDFEKNEKYEPFDTFDKIKYFFKKFNAFYYFLTWLLSPVYINNNLLKRFLKKYVNNKNCIAVNLGSGNSNISEEILNIDVIPYKNIDICCNIGNLPFVGNSIDVVMVVAVLEHVPSPEKVVKEIHRVLKKNGVVYALVPFIVGYHASPFDYSRRTYSGVKELFKDFTIIKIKNGGGPTSGLLWIFQEWIAILLSFGLKPIYIFIHCIMMILTFPIKFLDSILVYHPMAKNISSSFIFIGKK